MFYLVRVNDNLSFIAIYRPCHLSTISAIAYNDFFIDAGLSYGNTDEF